MSREDFVKREHEFRGHVYAIKENGELTKDGVVSDDLIVRADLNGSFRMFDKLLAVGKLKEDFGFTSNSYPYEGIGSRKVTLPNGNIDLVIRSVYRNEKGMYCEDVHTVYQPDGVTLVKEDCHREPAPFEILK